MWLIEMAGKDKFVVELPTVMKSVKTIKSASMLALLTAILILPTGANKQAMANNSSKIYSRPVTAAQGNCCSDEEEYSISVIKFFSCI